MEKERSGLEQNQERANEREYGLLDDETVRYYEAKKEERRAKIAHGHKEPWQEDLEEGSIHYRETKSPDKKKRVVAYLYFAKERLAEWLDIDDLSHLEELQLRRWVERCMDNEESQRQEPRRREHVVDITMEASAQWLLDCYGIQNNDIPVLYHVKDATAGKYYRFHESEQSLAQQKKENLIKKGHQVESWDEIPDDFKVYIRRLRDKSHHP